MLLLLPPLVLFFETAVGSFLTTITGGAFLIPLGTTLGADLIIDEVVNCCYDYGYCVVNVMITVCVHVCVCV